MAGTSGGRSLEETPTWAVAAVCFVLVLISIIVEHVIHLIGKCLRKKHKRALHDPLERVKSELMLLGFISLMLTATQGVISNICISTGVGDTWHPCSKKQEEPRNTAQDWDTESGSRRRILAVPGSGEIFRRVLASSGADKCTEKGKVAFVSSDGIHQLHIFIFVLAIFHVLYSVLTMALGKAKMKSWKAWEKETRTLEYQLSNDPQRFRFTRDTPFGRRHLSFWTKTPVLMWIVCFFRQFVGSVPKVDYLTLRHGFMTAHLAPQSQASFDFQKYINRSLEEDFKFVVGISPPIWFCAVLFLLFSTHGWYSYLWLPFIPLIIILLVGTKLQVIITKMAITMVERGEVVKGVPLVQPGDHLFWFNRPRLLLYLINFVLFQNAFELAFFVWTWKEFGINSCFHDNQEDIILRIAMGVLVQLLCSYVTLPLYALVTQMGSSMKPTMFSERVVTALRNWHRAARRRLRQNKGSVKPLSSSIPNTPSHHTSPVHLLRRYRPSDIEASPGTCNSVDAGQHLKSESTSSSPADRSGEGSSSKHNPQHEVELGHHLRYEGDGSEAGTGQALPAGQSSRPEQHEFYVITKDFSFDMRSSGCIIIPT